MSGDLSDLSVVVTSWNTRALLDACLGSLAAVHLPGGEAGTGAEVIVVDDASGDGSAEMVARRHGAVRLLADGVQRGYSAATNLGAAAATRPFVMLLNADTEVHPGALQTLLAFLRTHPGHGAAAPRLVNPDGTTQRACMDLPRLSTALFFATPLERWWSASPELSRYFLRRFDHDRDADVPQPPAAALMLPRDLWEDLGGFDESLRTFFSDVDLARRLAAAGRPIRFLWGAEVLHHGGASTRQLPDFVAEWHRDRLAYFRKHHGRGGGAWVKLCTTLAWADHLVGCLGRRARGQASEPVLPLCRTFGQFLVS